jgi:hypothetical protein
LSTALLAVTLVAGRVVTVGATGLVVKLTSAPLALPALLVATSWK